MNSFSRTAITRLALLAIFAAAPAGADIYIWTDERGTTVISDKPPANTLRVSNLETVVNEPERKGGKPRTGPREATPTEQRLLERVEDLERQVGAQRYTAPPPAAPAPPPAAGNAVTYSTAPPPPAPVYDAFHPQPSFLSFPYVISSPVIVRRGFGRHHFPHRRGDRDRRR